MGFRPCECVCGCVVGLFSRLGLAVSVGGWPGYEIIAFGSLLLASSAFRLLFIYLSRLANGNGNGWLDWNKWMVWMCGVGEYGLVR